MATDRLPFSALHPWCALALSVVLGAGATARAQDEDEGGPPERLGPLPDEVSETPRGDDGDGEPVADPVPPQRVYLIAVATSPELEAAAARVGAAARSALRRVPGAQWEGPDQAFLGYTDFMLERLRSARESLIAGRQAYLDLELEHAIELLTSAVEGFDAAAAAMEDPQDLGEALLYLGASQTFAGQVRAARRTFQRLHEQMPHIQPDPNVFNPDVVRRYEQSAPRDRDNPTASIVIDSEPQGAIAYVDFVPRGRTPVTVDDLMAGVHTVRVTRPGATPFVQEVELRAGSGGQVNAFLDDNERTAGLADTVQALATPDVETMESGTPIADIAVALELDKIGIIRVSSADAEQRVQLELLMYDVSDGSRILRMHGPAPTALGALEEKVNELVARGLDHGLRPRAEAERGIDQEVIPAFQGRTSEGSEDDGEGSVLGQWWFWAGAAAVVALGVVLTIVLTSGGTEVGQDTGGQIILEF